MLKPKRSRLTRLLEIFPGTLTCATLLGAPILAFYHPVWISLYIILFDLYWFLKGGNVAIHLMHSYFQLKTHRLVNWNDWLNRLLDPGKFKQYLREQIVLENSRRLKR